MNKFYAYFLGLALFSSSLAVQAQAVEETSENDGPKSQSVETYVNQETEALDVAVRKFKMGRSVNNWWQPLEWGQNFRPNIIIADLLNGYLINSKRWNCVSRMELNEIADELNLDSSGAVRSETAAEFGDLIGARFIITGLVSEFNMVSSGDGLNVSFPISTKGGGFSYKGGGKVRITATAKVIDTQTGTYLCSVESSKTIDIKDGGWNAAFIQSRASQYGDWGVGGHGGEIPDSALGNGMKAVALDLANQLNNIQLKPIKQRQEFEGSVVYADDTSVFIDLGKNEKLKKNTILRVYRPIKVKSKNGNVRTVNKTIGKLKVSVVGDPSECKVIECEQRIQDGDKVSNI